MPGTGTLPSCIFGIPQALDLLFVHPANGEKRTGKSHPLLKNPSLEVTLARLLQSTGTRTSDTASPGCKGGGKGSPGGDPSQGPPGRAGEHGFFLHIALSATEETRPGGKQVTGGEGCFMRATYSGVRGEREERTIRIPVMGRQVNHIGKSMDPRRFRLSPGCRLLGWCLHPGEQT